MSCHEIQSLLDEHKEELQDNLYLKLSNLIMEKNKNNKSFYKATYVKPVFRPKENSNDYELEIVSETRIIEMTNENYNSHLICYDNIIKHNAHELNRHRVIERIDNEFNDDDNIVKVQDINIYNSEYLVNLVKI
jgi:hypothetical protein